MIPDRTGTTPAEAAPRDSDAMPLVQLIHEISKCYRSMRTVLRSHARRWTLSDTEFLVLWLCQRACPEGVGQSELAAAAGVSAATMSGLVEQLRQRGYLDPRRNQDDRRRQLWRPTAEGRDLLEKIETQLAESFQAIRRSLPPRERQLLVDSLRRLTHVTDHPIGLAVVQEDSPTPNQRTEAQYDHARRRAV